MVRLCLLAILPLSGATSAVAAETLPPVDGALLVLAAEARFESDGSTLTLASRESLAALLDKLDPGATVHRVRIVGHTDSVGPARYNLQLSQRRAATMARLIQALRPDWPISVRALGETRAVADNATPAGRALNRRVDIHVIATGPPDER